MIITETYPIVDRLVLQQESASIDQPWIYILLLAIGGILFLIQFKYMFFPTWKGKIMEFKDPSVDACSVCKGKSTVKTPVRAKGKSSIDIKVRTTDGQVIDAEVSPCTICLNKLKPGSRVGVSKIGSRNVAQPIVRFFRTETW